MKISKAKLGRYGICGAVLMLGLTGAIASLGAPQAAAPSQPFFPVAVWHGGGKTRVPMQGPLDSTSAERWGKDLDQIKAIGFNTVKCWVDWATAEPKPGQFDFQNLNLLMRLAQERGLPVIVQIYSDSSPDWVGQRYPDARFVDLSGAVIHSQAAPGYSIDDPDVHKAIVKFIPVEAARPVLEASHGLPGMNAGQAVRGDSFEEELEPFNGGHVLARFADGQPAMVESTFDKGKAILAGTFLALSYEREHDPSTGRLLRSLAQAAGIRADVKVSGAGTSEVEVRRLVSPQEQLVFIFNHAQKPAQPSISIHAPWSVHEAQDVVTGRLVKFKTANGSVVLNKILRGGEIWLVKLNAGA